MQTLFPTLLTTSNTSSAVVTSTDTQRLDCFRSMIPKSRLAVGLEWSSAREAYVLVVDGCGDMVNINWTSDIDKDKGDPSG